jgi:hypothetical protein
MMAMVVRRSVRGGTGESKVVGIGAAEFYRWTPSPLPTIARRIRGRGVVRDV